MPDENKSTYTPARKKAISKYLHGTVEEFKVRLPKGRKSEIKAHAESQGESLNSFVIRAIDQAIAQDQKEGE